MGDPLILRGDDMHPFENSASPAVHDDVFALWDRLAGFSAADGDAAPTHLLTTLCAMVTAQLFEAMPAAWFEGEHYRRHYLEVGHSDSIQMRCSLNDDVRVPATNLRLNPCRHCIAVYRLLRGLRS